MIDDMKKILLLALPLMVMCFASCEKDKGNGELSGDDVIQFKDPIFLQMLLSGEMTDADEKPLMVDTNGDNQISVNEAQKVTSLVLEAYDDNGDGEFSYNLTNIEELKYFTSMTYFECEFSPVTKVDFSNNKVLKEVYMEDNELTSINVNGCTALERLFVEYGNLANVDVSSCISLESLDCSYNRITALDISHNASLTELDCSGNPLQTLTISESQQNVSWLNNVKSEYPDIEIIVK